ncbi:small acid-soluble spore protein Tlp [Thalassobacillus sp. CUG 92003]|uniref:small acid-soluble spore protein Tlp n=1 Tax=Thalassobacillus sp. CUG 92003 TaxID=2736641 RepID=UPI0015E6ABBE|nr:small acid-soluble spore protein Tlp [Thalassobacillus sp. CUG 92003]
MSDQQRRAKPDDRSDNVDRLQQAVQNTIENIEASHDRYGLASENEQAQIAKKNEKREQSIKGMRQEIKEEAHYQDNR